MRVIFRGRKEGKKRLRNVYLLVCLRVLGKGFLFVCLRVLVKGIKDIAI